MVPLTIRYICKLIEIHALATDPSTPAKKIYKMISTYLFKKYIIPEIIYQEDSNWKQTFIGNMQNNLIAIC